MFYLLENNRIIDSNNPPIHWKYLKVIIDEDNKNICVFCKDTSEAEFYTIVDKKENIFDLTKCGDLIKFQQTLTFNNIVLEQFVLLNENNIEHLLNTWQCSYSDILAIYKPDEKGNYIKVWERKEE